MVCILPRVPDILGLFQVFYSPLPQAKAKTIRQLTHNHSLPCPSQFIIYSLPYRSKLYGLGEPPSPKLLDITDSVWFQYLPYRWHVKAEHRISWLAKWRSLSQASLFMEWVSYTGDAPCGFADRIQTKGHMQNEWWYSLPPSWKGLLQ